MLSAFDIDLADFRLERRFLCGRIDAPQTHVAHVTSLRSQNLPSRGQCLPYGYHQPLLLAETPNSWQTEAGRAKSRGYPFRLSFSKGVIDYD